MERLSALDVNRSFAACRLVAPNDHVDVERIKLDAAANPAVDSAAIPPIWVSLEFKTRSRRSRSFDAARITAGVTRNEGYISQLNAAMAVAARGG